MTQFNLDDMSDISRHLLHQWEQGNQDGATRIFSRYVDRLVRYVNVRISAKMRVRFGASDVVQSAFREFFAKAQKHEIVLRRSGALWRVLAAIAINKLNGQLEYELAKKRSPRHEEASLGPGLDEALLLIDRDPTPDQIAAVLEVLDQVMSQMRPVHRQVLAMRMEGMNIERIGSHVKLTEGYVRTILRDAENELRKRLNDQGDTGETSSAD